MFLCSLLSVLLDILLPDRYHFTLSRISASIFTKVHRDFHTIVSHLALDFYRNIFLDKPGKAVDMISLIIGILISDCNQFFFISPIYPMGITAMQFFILHRLPYEL